MYNSDKERWEEYELRDESSERYLWAFYEEVYFFLTLNADKTYASKSLEKNRTDYEEGADKPDYDEYESYFEDNGTWSLSKDGAFSLKMKKVYVKSTKEGETKEATFNSYEEFDDKYDYYYPPEFCSEYFCEESLEYKYDDYLGIKGEEICSIKELTSTKLVIEIKPSDKTMEELKKLYKEKKEEDWIREALEDETARSIFTFKKVK